MMTGFRRSLCAPCPLRRVLVAARASPVSGRSIFSMAFPLLHVGLRKQAAKATEHMACRRMSGLRARGVVVFQRIWGWITGTGLTRWMTRQVQARTATVATMSAEKISAGARCRNGSRLRSSVKSAPIMIALASVRPRTRVGCPARSAALRSSRAPQSKRSHAG